MYTRFYRWAFDRIENQGIIAFITNRSFIDSRSFDGFRLVAAQEFEYLYIIDTHSDVRANPKISGTKNNVFGIQTGVAVMFLVKIDREEERIAHDAANPGKPFHRHARIKYKEMKDEDTRVEKLQWFAHNRFRDVVFKDLFPDEKGYWFPTEDNEEWEAMISVANPLVKKGKHKEDAIFQLYSLGVVTARDEWVYDYDTQNLTAKMDYFSKYFNSLEPKFSEFDDKIKWSSTLKSKPLSGIREPLDSDKTRPFLFRPYISEL